MRSLGSRFRRFPHPWVAGNRCCNHFVAVRSGGYALSLALPAWGPPPGWSCGRVVEYTRPHVRLGAGRSVQGPLIAPHLQSPRSPSGPGL